ncbi:MAG: DUF3422 domain-containing protein [Rhodobacteraceae bacterium]|nr:DUF3422 domain-containing protein [Paracoccaceae bacterium]
MAKITDNPERYALANELHARPFPSIAAPCRAAYLAIKQPVDAASRDRGADRAHLLALLKRHGATEPPEGATHYFGQIGKHMLKWESHTEFVTYTVFGEGVADPAFDGRTFEMFPADWLEAIPGERVTSALIRVEELEQPETVREKLHQWMVPESLAASWVVDRTAIIAGDFRIDAQGHMRFAVFVQPGTGARRVGRIVQRLAEIETYKTMSLLGLPVARMLSRRINEIEEDLTGVVDAMRGEADKPEETLNRLLVIAADLAGLAAQSSFRMGATGAYATLVNQRIEVLREERFDGRQTFAEFMMRRFDPAMRTVKSAEARLTTMSDRATRAANLLRTRVDVDRSAVNQALLESMDRRADLQLRLQKTVEGLSVVAISYYAVNLVLYVLSPFAESLQMSKVEQAALVTPLVVLGVWLAVRRIRNEVE